MNRIWIIALPFLVFLALAPAYAQNSSVFGRWKEPEGSVIEVDRCASNICARMVAISKTAPGHFDADNPNAALRSRTLCGLRIGSNFHLTDANHADGGQIYDPKTGKTYSGSMTSEGDTCICAATSASGSSVVPRPGHASAPTARCLPVRNRSRSRAFVGSQANSLRAFRCGR